MLSCQEFNRLSSEDKSEFAFDEQYCTYLMSRWENATYSFNLYHVTHAPGGAYFIEMWYDEEKNRIEGFRSFKKALTLASYLNCIDIREVRP